jgi:DNA-binding GntR family transcriptional regulator
LTIVEPRFDSPSKTTVDQIQERILERICFAYYRPGDQLKETALAKEFGVSRTAVRDAIARIGHLGLVETRNGVGTIVIELSDERIRHVYEMRMKLATLIGEMSPASIETSHYEEALSIHERALMLRKEPIAQEYVKLNRRLQTLIKSLIGNSLLCEFWNQVYYQASSVWHRMERKVGFEAYDALVEETSDLLIALERNDINAVGYVQRLHIGYGFQRIEEFVFKKDI